MSKLDLESRAKLAAHSLSRALHYETAYNDDAMYRIGMEHRARYNRIIADLNEAEEPAFMRVFVPAFCEYLTSKEG